VRQPRTIRGRMVRTLAVPLATMLGLLGFIAVGEVQTYRRAVAISDAVGLTLAVQDLVHELQRERGLTNGLLGGETRYRSDVDNQRPRVNTARAALDALTADHNISGVDVVLTASDLLDDLGTVRRNVDAGGADRPGTFDYYTNAIDALGGLNIGANESEDSILLRDLDALQSLGDAKEAAAKERGFLNGVFAAGKFSAGEYARFADIRGAKRAALTQFARHATDAQQARLDAALRSTAATRASGHEEAAIAASDGRPVSVDSRVWWDAMTGLVDDLRGVQQSVGVEAQARTADLRTRAATELVVLLVLAVLVSAALAGEAMLLISSARSITAPLADLAREADEVASRRLPEAVARIQAAPDNQLPPAPVVVPARAAAEISQVAQAFGRVQQVAYELATEQAVVRRNTTESLANLGHRNQNLLRRQLSFISQLERDESDPTALANLFELDHLATRMRRNAESLLVLVGETSPRRWATPLPVADVIRAAIAEVEDYRRVELRRIDNAYVTGGMVSDLAHMIAELVENGLAFSPPELDVEIYGQWIGTKYLVAVLDQGVGMTEEDLARANARLRGEESFLIGPARFLGHYVVGRLASELGASVQLACSPVTGVTARLVLPPGVVSASSEQIQPEPQADSLQQEGAERPNTAPQSDAPRHPVSAMAVAPGFPWLVDPANGTTPTPYPTRGNPTTPVSGIDGSNGAAPGSDRTRSGLVKRTPRAQVTVRKPLGPAPGIDGAATELQPAEVQTMLSAFRAGTQRGESRSSTSASTTQGNEGGSQ